MLVVVNGSWLKMRRFYQDVEFSPSGGEVFVTDEIFSDRKIACVEYWDTVVEVLIVMFILSVTVKLAFVIFGDVNRFLEPTT